MDINVSCTIHGPKSTHLNHQYEWESFRKDSFVSVVMELDPAVPEWPMDTILQLRTELIRNYYRDEDDYIFSFESPPEIIKMFNAIVEVEEWQECIKLYGTYLGLANLMRLGDLSPLDNWNDWYLAIERPYDTGRTFYYSWKNKGLAERRNLNDWIGDDNALITTHPPNRHGINRKVTLEMSNLTQVSDTYRMDSLNLGELRASIRDAG